MKRGILRSSAHNIADSFASRMGFPIGVHLIDVFKEAAASPGGFLTVDLLRGTVDGGHASPSLHRAVQLYRDVLPDLLAKQQVSIESLRVLTARFSNGETRVVIEDTRGRRYQDDYFGVPLKLRPVVDASGRVRRKRR